jgi:excisionase family DNA binding protein
MAEGNRTNVTEHAGLVIMMPLLTPEQVSEHLRVPLGTLANWRYQGRGPAFVRFGRHVRYRASDVTEWINRHLANHAR